VPPPLPHLGATLPIDTPLSSFPIPVTLIAKNWEAALALHPEREEVRVAVEGIRLGARVMYSGPRRARVSPNLQSALENAEAVTADIKKEVDAGRMAGPFSHPPSANFISSPIGTVPKKGTDEVRRIHHLSHPSGSSVNDNIADS
jgi:hypothetical protein